MAKVATLFLVALLLCSTLAYAARHEPGTVINSQPEVAVEGEQAEYSCDGVGEDECLMRRTLAAHLDYIYTQKTKP